MRERVHQCLHASSIAVGADGDTPDLQRGTLVPFLNHRTYRDVFGTIRHGSQRCINFRGDTGRRSATKSVLLEAC